MSLLSNQPMRQGIFHELHLYRHFSTDIISRCGSSEGHQKFHLKNFTNSEMLSLQLFSFCQIIAFFIMTKSWLMVDTITKSAVNISSNLSSELKIQSVIAHLVCLFS